MHSKEDSLIIKGALLALGLKRQLLNDLCDSVEYWIEQGKEEWADMPSYVSMKADIEGLRSDIRALTKKVEDEEKKTHVETTSEKGPATMLDFKNKQEGKNNTH